jgi:hypothetical protein
MINHTPFPLDGELRFPPSLKGPSPQGVVSCGDPPFWPCGSSRGRSSRTRDS